MGLTADTSGTFHCLWIDSRSGSSQVWTSRIRFYNLSNPAQEADLSSVRKLSDKDVSLLLDPGSYDPATNEMIVNVRIKNNSTKIIRTPLIVEIRNLKGSSPAVKPQLMGTRRDRHGKEIFDYSDALGNARYLQPGEVSEAVQWRLVFGTGSPDNLEIVLDVSGDIAEN